LILYQQHKLDEAAAYLEQTVRLNPDHVVARRNYGLVLNATGLAQLNQGRWSDALKTFDRILALDPAHAEALNNRAHALHQLHRFDEAAASYAAALAQRPGDADILKNRGLMRLELRRYADALADFDAALATRASFAEAWNERGNTLQKLNRIDEALASFDHAIALKPDYAAAHSHRGGALMRLRRMDEALNAYAHAQAIDPQFAKAHLNEGMCRLLTGDFERGWPKYEYRWQCEPLSALQKHFDAPLWLGQGDIAGKTILLHAEQGAGDTIQFCRYAPLLAARGARVLLQVQSSLKTLLANLDGVSGLYSDAEALPAFDLHCPLMSLPLACKPMIPAQISYLQATPEAVNTWAARLPARTRPRIGLVWSGDPRHGEDHNRSIALERFAPLLKTNGEFFSLQKEIRPADLTWLRDNGRVHDVSGALNDFSDTAAMVSHMDIVVTVDTSVAHLAGALGKPTWILLPYIGVDWRWLLTRTDSPWYPTARLYRQPAIHDWDSVIAHVAADLATLAAHKA
ncbi:MAG: tetratricopeptide repeat protein, partial [Rhodospirillaceae bacterium]|nr:tetratricopeptide repeat protein [Rhodospirillaceae bacterium]